MTNLRDQINSILSGASDPDEPAQKQRRVREPADQPRSRPRPRATEPELDEDDDDGFERALRTPVQRTRRRKRSQDELDRLASMGRDTELDQRARAGRRAVDKLRRWEQERDAEDDADEEDDVNEDEQEVEQPTPRPAETRGPAYMPQAQTDDWCSPRVIMDAVALVFEGGVDLDPCASTSEHNLVDAKVKFAIDEGHDGLALDWSEVKSQLDLERPMNVYVNCPYGRAIAEWLERLDACTRGSGYEAHGIALLSARTDTDWFHTYVQRAAAVCYVQGRLKYGGAKDPAPFASLVLLFTDDDEVIDRFEQAFGVSPVVSGKKGKRPLGTVSRRRPKIFTSAEAHVARDVLHSAGLKQLAEKIL
jgi:site-specific DNA-methyltransferase (adenine-specific)